MGFNSGFKELKSVAFGFRDVHGDMHVFASNLAFCTPLANDMYKSEFPYCHQVLYFTWLLWPRSQSVYPKYILRLQDVNC